MRVRLTPSDDQPQVLIAVGINKRQPSRHAHGSGTCPSLSGITTPTSQLPEVKARSTGAQSLAKIDAINFKISGLCHRNPVPVMVPLLCK